MKTGAAVMPEFCSGSILMYWGDSEIPCDEFYEQQVGINPLAEDVLQIQAETFIDYDEEEVFPESESFESLQVEVIGRTLDGNRFAVCRLWWNQWVRMCFIEYGNFTLLLGSSAFVLYEYFGREVWEAPGSLDVMHVGMGAGSFKAIIPSKVLLQSDRAYMRRKFHAIFPAGELLTSGSVMLEQFAPLTLYGWIMAERGAGLEPIDVQDTSEGTARTVTVINLARLLPLCILSIIAAIIKVVVKVLGRNRAVWLPTDIAGVYKQARFFHEGLQNEGGTDYRTTRMPEYSLKDDKGQDLLSAS